MSRDQRLHAYWRENLRMITILFIIWLGWTAIVAVAFVILAFS